MYLNWPGLGIRCRLKAYSNMSLNAPAALRPIHPVNAPYGPPAARPIPRPPPGRRPDGPPPKFWRPTSVAFGDRGTRL